VLDLGGWASNRALQKASLKDRGVGLRKTLVEHMQSKGDLTFESYAETLKKDSVGRLILDLDIPGLKKKFTDAQLAKMGLEPSTPTPTVVKKDVVFETITPEEPKPKEEEVIIVKEEEVKQEEPKEEIKEEFKQEEVPVVVETKEEPKEETKQEEPKEEEPKEEPKVSSVPLTKVDDETSTLSVPNKLHQYCIGKGGSIIKEISSTSGSKLNLEGDNIQIKGGDINKAVELVMNALSHVGWFYENNSWVERTKQDELWKKYRGEAQKEVELRNECYEKSKKAFEEGNKELASQLSEEGKSHDEKWKVLTAEAASNIFNEMNQNNDKNTIDLHGLFVDEALGFVKERLAELKGNGSMLSIITGAGNHSAGGQALIKPKIHELLKEEGLTFTEEKNGQVDVQM
jgi:DNA-nicking Smr family endonuclease